MYLPTLSASLLDVALSFLCKLKPVCASGESSVRKRARKAFPEVAERRSHGEEHLDTLIMEAGDLMKKTSLEIPPSDEFLKLNFYFKLVLL